MISSTPKLNKLRSEKEATKMIAVMVAGLPGKMATLVMEAVKKTEGLELMSVALSKRS